MLNNISVNEERIVIFINEVFNKKIDKIKDLNNDYKNLELYLFLKFLENKDNLNFLNEILFYSSTLFTKFFKEKISKNIKISSENYFILNSIFVIKSLSNINFDDDIENFYSSDDVIQKHLTLEKKFWVYTSKKKYPYCDDFRKLIIKVYSILVYMNIINEEKININNKIYKEWKMKIKIESQISIWEKFSMSFNKYEVYEDEDSFFLISDFFMSTTEIFKKNNNSNHRFELFDKNYLKKILDISLYFDEESFDSIFKKINTYDIPHKFLEISNEMNLIKNEYNEYKKITSIDYKEALYDVILKDSFKIKKIDNDLGYKIKILNKINILKNDNKIYDIEEIWESLKTKFKTNKKILENMENEITNSLNNLNEIEIFDNNERENFIKENFKKISNVYKKNKIVSSKVNNEFIENINLIKDTKKKYIEKQKEWSKIKSDFIFYSINKNKEIFLNKKIYFPIYFDFRGRLYINSRICITELKLSRYFWTYGYYSNEEIKKESSFSLSQIKKYLNYSNEIIKIFDIKNNKNYSKEVIFWCILAIGKEFIKKDKSCFTIEEILSKGVDKLKNENNEDDIEKWVILEHYKKIITSLDSEKILKRFIQKDATASFIQNTIKIVGPKNDQSLEYANLLRNDVWYDTYSLSLEKWIENLDIKEDYFLIEEKKYDKDLLKYFNRKTIKKPVMVGPYSASYKTKKEYFHKAIRIEFNEDLSDNKEINEIFLNFINFVEKVFWDKFYLNENSKIMIDHISKILENKMEPIIESEDSKTNLSYKIMIDKRFDWILHIEDKKIRITKIVKKVGDVNDNKKIKRSSRANWVHYVDAKLTRDINKCLDEYLLTVHDAFFIHQLKVSKFVKAAYESFKKTGEYSIAKNKEEFKKINSIHIFI